MAALPYIQLYVADYLSDTQHLSLEEHGAYLLIIFNYWQRGKAPCDDDKRFASICSTDVQRWLEIRSTLAEFFDIKDGVWVHHRIEKDLDKVRRKSEQAAKAGKASGASRSAKPGIENGRSPAVERGVNYTDTETNTDTEEKHSKEKIPFSEIVSYLNEKTGASFKGKTASTQNLIKARWNDGFRVEDFKTVIDKKTAEWKDDEKFSTYLRPLTLFGQKFESYLQAVSKKTTSDWV